MLVLTTEQKTTAIKNLIGAFNSKASRECDNDGWDYGCGVVSGDAPASLAPQMWGDSRRVIDDEKEIDILFEIKERSDGNRIVVFTGTLRGVCAFWAEHLVDLAAQKAGDDVTIEDVINDDYALEGAIEEMNIEPFDPMYAMGASMCAYLKDVIGQRKINQLIDAYYVIHDLFSDEFFGENWTIESASIVGFVCEDEDEIEKEIKDPIKRIEWVYRIARILYNDPMLPTPNLTPSHYLRDGRDAILQDLSYQIDKIQEDVDEEMYDYT